MTRWRVVVASLLATGVVHAAPRPLRASLPPAAKADYLEARQLFEDGDAAGALVKFEEAYTLAQDPRLLWNEAVCEKSLRHYAHVRALLARYLAEGGALVTAEDRAEAGELAKAIEPFTTSLTVTASEPGADVTLDDDALGATPLPGPVVVDIGPHVVTVTKAGFRAWSERVAVGERRAETVEARLVAAGGALVVGAPRDAAISIDGNVVGTGSLTVPLAVGGHAVRVTAPGFLPYESDVVVEDAATRRLDVALVRDARDPRSSELRVAVGCGDPVPRTPVDGLAITIDGAPAAEGAVVDGYDEVEQRSAPDFVRLRVAPGKHVVRAFIPDCVPSETRIVASDDAPAIVAGSLARDHRELLRGPAGTPDHWRVAFSGLVHFVPRPINSASIDNAIGGLGTVAYTARWFLLAGDFGLSSGDAQAADIPALGIHNVPQTATHAIGRIRAGVRVPLDRVALSAGVGVGVETISAPVNASGLVFPLWGAIDVHALCEWAIPLAVSSTSLQGAPVVSLEIGLAFQPNHQCRREEDTVHGL